MTDPTSAIEGIQTLLGALVRVARGAYERAAIDRSKPSAPLNSALLGLLGWVIAEATCAEAALRTDVPQGVAPNVRSMLESLLTAGYLTDPHAVPSERRDRLDKYFWGVRRAQVQLRDNLDAHPDLKRVFNVDQELAAREKAELAAHDGALPKNRRRHGHWSGLPEGLKTIASVVGLASDYAVQYRIYSGSVHGNRPWDQARFDPGGPLIVPSLQANRDLAIPMAFDALRYLAWMLSTAAESGAVALERDEQGALGQLSKYCEPLESLFAKGIVGPAPNP